MSGTEQDQQHRTSFKDRWVAAGQPPRSSPAETAALEAANTVTCNTGLIVEHDDAGHACFVAQVYMPPEQHRFRIEPTPRVIGEAVAYVERTARPWRRQMLAQQWRGTPVAERRPRPAARPQRRRESHARPARRVASRQGDSGDDGPAEPEDPGPGEPAPLILLGVDWRAP